MIKYTDTNINNKIHIVLSADNNYFKHLIITLASILKNANRNDKFVFYILDGGIDEVKKAIKKPTIIHYTTSMKPWLNYTEHKYYEEYFKYLKYTPYYKEYYDYLFKKFKANIQLIISIKNLDNHKIFTFCGIKIKFRRRNK